MLEQFLFEQTFDLRALSSDYRKALMQAINGKLTTIGSGNQRRVFQLENRKVLKIAKNVLGTITNKIEADTSDCLGSKFFPKVFQHSSDVKGNYVMNDEETNEPITYIGNGYAWLVVEQVKSFNPDNYGYDDTDPVLDKAVMNEYGVRFQELRRWLMNEKPSETLDNNPLAKELKQTIDKCDVYSEDLWIANFGIRNNNHLVIVDYG